MKQTNPWEHRAVDVLIDNWLRKPETGWKEANLLYLIQQKQYLNLECEGYE